MSRKVDPVLRQQTRAAISDAYYDARNEGQTMEWAADRATDAVLKIMASVDENAHLHSMAEERGES